MSRASAAFGLVDVFSQTLSNRGLLDSEKPSCTMHVEHARIRNIRTLARNENSGVF
jgi:hypothetical protein